MNPVKKKSVTFRLAADLEKEIVKLAEDKRLSKSTIIESLLRLQLDMPVPNPMDKSP